MPIAPFVSVVICIEPFRVSVTELLNGGYQYLTYLDFKGAALDNLYKAKVKDLKWPLGI